nr:hypothetical protein [Halovivax gelatinilyticus]
MALPRVVVVALDDEREVAVAVRNGFIVGGSNLFGHVAVRFAIQSLGGIGEGVFGDGDDVDEQLVVVLEGGFREDAGVIAV